MFNYRKYYYPRLAGIGAALFLAISPLIAWAAPKVFYTDILTGPNSGGENNDGAYLTLFGSGFGASASP